MAIVKMKRLSLAVIRSKKEALLNELLKLGCVEFSEIQEAVAGSEAADILKRESSEIMKLRNDLQLVQGAISVLDRCVPAKTALLSSKPEVDKNTMMSSAGVDTALTVSRRIIDSDNEIKRISGEESRQRSIIESLKPWLEFPMPLQTTGTKRASVLMGSIPAAIKIEDVKNCVEEVTDEAEIFLVSEDKTAHYVVLVIINEMLAPAVEALRKCSFTQITFTGMTGSAQSCSDRANLELKSLAEEKVRCSNEIAAEAVIRDDLKLAFDKISSQIAKAEAEEKLFGTESVVMMEGWVPEESEGKLEEILEKYDCAYETRDPEEEEYPAVPVSLRNNKITDGLNMVTNMYSLPAYGTVDPNPLMAPFFILFYGLMMADMGYGLLMIIAAVIAIKKIKPEGGMLSFSRLLLWGGISTFLMGAITGGFFSDAPKQIYDLICQTKGIEPTWQGLPKLFSPTEDSIMVLVGSLVLGLLHLNAGMVVSFVQKWKSGDKASAIWEEGTLWLLLIAGVVFALKKTGIVPQIPETAALVFLIVAIAALLFGAGREAKGFGKVTAAFGCIYNTATGWFGDILSYSRIMALMLAGGVIGQVFNTVAILPAQSSGLNVITALAFIIIFLLGHAMNFGLNLLGCYVHDLRLQCLEFFGKFYQDGGKAFRPLKLGGKYVKVKQE